MRLTRTVAVAVALAALLAAGCRGSPSGVHAASSPVRSASPIALRPLLTVRPRARGFSGFFFASGRIYWAMLSTQEDGVGGVRAFRFDLPSRRTSQLRRLDTVVGPAGGRAIAFAPGRVAVLGQAVLWRGAGGTDGFRGVLAQPLSIGGPTGSALRRVGPPSIAFVANGGVLSRNWISLSRDALVWDDARLTLTSAPLPPPGGESLPAVARGKHPGLWAYAFGAARAYRVPGCSSPTADGMVLAGRTAYWPSTRPAHGPIVAYDLLSRSRSIVPGSESLTLAGGAFVRSMAASANVVVWTTRRGSRTTLAGFDRRGETIPPLSQAAVPTDPAVGGGVIVWLDHRRGKAAPAVYGIDLRTGREFAVALDREPKSGLRVDGDHVYWSSAPSNGGVHARVRLYGVSLSRAGGMVQVTPL